MAFYPGRYNMSFKRPDNTVDYTSWMHLGLSPYVVKFIPRPIIPTNQTRGQTIASNPSACP